MYRKKEPVTGAGVPESEFNMWRAVFAFAFVDGNLSLEEQELLHSYLRKARFSTPQRRILLQDMIKPQDTEKMFSRIGRPEDKERFCVLARAIVWCEGSMERQEAEILRRLHCLEGSEGHDYLYRSRFHPHLHDYYKHYAKAGAAGLLDRARRLRLSA